MNDTIKKLVLFGIGSLELTKEAVTKFMKDLEKEGALDKSEGKKVVRQTFKELDQNLKKFQKGVEKEMAKLEKDRKASKTPKATSTSSKSKVVAKKSTKPKATPKTKSA